jgi:integrase
MAVYKLHRCGSCGYNRTTPRPPKTAEPCPRCGDPLAVSSDWYIGYTHQGRKHRRRIGPRKEDAENALRKAKVNIAEGRSRLNVAPQTPWHEARQRFLAWATEAVTANGAAMFRSCMNRLDEFIHDGRTLDTLSREEIEVDYVRFRRSGGYRCRPCKIYIPAADRSLRECPQCRTSIRRHAVADSTINRELTTVHRMMVKCEEWGLVEQNPLRGLHKLSEPEGRTRYLTEPEITKLLDECSPSDPGAGNDGRRGRPRGPHLRLAVVIALNTGLRKGDVLHMRWSDVDFKSGRLTPWTEKTDRRVTIPMTEEIRQALQEYRQAQRVTGIDGWIFPSLRGHDPSQPVKPMRPDANIGFEAAAVRAGLRDFRFHDLRHTFATHFLRQMAMSYGRDMALVMLQELLGHTDIKLTRRYAHLLDEDKQTAMRVFRLTGKSE